jgi:hypothetical protein
MILFIQKCKVPRNKLLSITLQAWYHLHQMTAVMKGDGNSVTSIQEEHLLGNTSTTCRIIVPRKLLQIHQAKNLFAAAWFTWCILSDTFCWISQQPHVRSWSLKVPWKHYIPVNVTVSSEFGGDLFSRFRFQNGWLEPEAFCRHILLTISTTSCLILEFESVLESLHSGNCDCFLRIWWQRVLAISISSWMTGTRCIFADTICWQSQWPHVWSWNLKVSWKVCIQANAAFSTEFGGKVFSRFQLQVWWLDPDAFLPTHFVGYLNDLMSDLGLWKCIGKSAFRQMQLFPQNLVATCSCNFDCKLDDWKQLHFGQHFIVTLQPRRRYI